MAQKIKNRQKQNFKKAQKKKARQSKLKQQAALKPLKVKPDVEDKVDYALSVVDDGDLQEASRLLTQLKKKHKNDPFVFYGLGVVAAFDGRYEEAIPLFQQAVQIKPDFVEAHFNMAVAYQKELNIAEMIKAYQNVLMYAESDSEFFYKAKDMLDGIERQMRRDGGIGLDEFLEATRFFERGFEYMKAGNMEAAIPEFKKTIEINPGPPQSFGNLGICYASLGKRQEALHAFDRALEKDPKYEPAMMNRVIVESMEEGECLPKGMHSVEYYKDYLKQNRSYIKEMAEKVNHPQS